jgi:hypothetical protein
MSATAAIPRRVTLGLEQNRLAMLLAVLHRHGGVAMYDQDVYVNAVGGVRINETAADLAVLLAALSSFRDRPLPTDLVVFGEVGLGRGNSPGAEWRGAVAGSGQAWFQAGHCAPRQSAPSAPGQVLLVSNEVGQSIVPDNPLARQFRDEAGRLHQAVASRCDRVIFVVAGLPLTLKDRVA